MSLAGELRFYFDIDYKNSAEIVRDRLNPGASDWKNHAPSDWSGMMSGTAGPPRVTAVHFTSIKD